MLKFDSKVVSVGTAISGELPFKIVALKHIAEMIGI